MRSLGHVLGFFLHPHDYETCQCDMRLTMAFACAEPWCREQVLQRGAYALGSCTFTLEELREPSAAIAEVGEAPWREHQRRYAVQQGEGDTLPRQCRRVGPHPQRLTIQLHRDDEDVDAASAELRHDESPGRLTLPSVLTWWRPCGWAVHLVGRRCSLAELEALLAVVQDVWGSPVTGLCVEGHSRPNPPAEVASVARLMQAAADTLRYLEVECLEMPPPLPETTGAARGEVRRLVLNNCAVPLPHVAAWLRDSPLEALFLSSNDPFALMHPTRRAADGVKEATGPPTTELTALTPPTLRHLMLDETNATPQHIASIRCRQALSRLSLIDCDQMDEVDLSHMENLQALLLSRCLIASTDALINLAHCQRLVLLNLCGCSELTDINAIAALPYLKELFAYQIGVTNSGIAEVGQCTSLEKINLGGCQRLNNVSPLGNLTRLKNLALWGTRVNNAGIAALGGCTALDELVLDDCRFITDVTPLASLANLRWLSLIGTNVTVAGVAALSRCPKLEALAITGTEIRNAPRLWSHDTVLHFLERVMVD